MPKSINQKAKLLYIQKFLLEETDETNFWLSFIKDLDLIKESKELEFLITESSELTAIFAKSSKTLSLNKSNF